MEDGYWWWVQVGVAAAALENLKILHPAKKGLQITHPTPTSPPQDPNPPQ